MKKIEIKDKKEFIKKFLDFMVTGEYKVNEFVTLNKTGSINMTIDESADKKSIIIKFLDKKPRATITVDYLPDPSGDVDRIVITENYVRVMLDGLPDVQAPVVS